MTNRALLEQLLHIALSLVIACVTGCTEQSDGGGGGAGGRPPPTDMAGASFGAMPTNTGGVQGGAGPTGGAPSATGGLPSGGGGGGPVVSSEGSLEVYPAPPGLAPSSNYEVTLIQGEQRYPVFVYQTEPKADRGHSDDDGGNEFRDKWQAAGAPYRSFSWVTFAFTGQVTVEIKLKTTTFQAGLVRPSRHGIAVERIDERTARFVVTEAGAKLSVEFDQSTDDALLIFADGPEPPDSVVRPTDPDTFVAEPNDLEAPEGAKAVYFGPGVYDLGRWHAPESVERVYLAGGAVVYGSLDIDARPSFKLSGRGILSGHKFVFRAHRDTLEHMSGSSETKCWTQCLKLVELWSVEDAAIEGVTLLESPYYFVYPQGSTVLQMRGFKLLGSWTWNTDGPELTRGGVVEDCFVQTNDDMFKLYHSDAVVRRCVAWHMHNGGMFQMGWTTKSFSNVKVSDIDVIHAEWRWSDNLNNGIINHTVDASGVFQPSGSGTIENVEFRDIRAEGTLLRAVGLYAFKGMVLRDFTIENLSVERFGGDISPRMAIENEVVGYNGGHVENVAIRNMTVGGQVVTTETAGALGKFVIDAGSTSGVGFSP